MSRDDTLQTQNQTDVVVTRKTVKSGIRAEVICQLKEIELTEELHKRLGESVSQAEDQAESTTVGARSIYYSELTGPARMIAIAIRIDLIECNKVSEAEVFVRTFARGLLLHLLQHDLISDMTVAMATIGDEVYEYRLSMKEALSSCRGRNKSKIIIYGIHRQISSTLLEDLEEALKRADDAMSGYSLSVPCHRFKLQREDGMTTLTTRFCFMAEGQSDDSRFGMTPKERVSYLANAANELRLACDPEGEQGLQIIVIDDGQFYYPICY